MIFSKLEAPMPDELVEVSQAFRLSQNPAKLDLGVGVYRNELGKTPTFRCVQKAEARLLADGLSKSYIPQCGEPGFASAIQQLLFGRTASPPQHLICAQAVGGTGALRLAAELITLANPTVTFHVGLPTWSNHLSLFSINGAALETYEYYRRSDRAVMFETLVETLERAKPGDVFVLQAGCHNPTGLDLTADQWDTVIQYCLDRMLIPVIDAPYLGLAGQFDDDLVPVVRAFEKLPQAIVAFSCSKSFGLYAERTAALVIKARSADELVKLRETLNVIVRQTYSSPPRHGADIVRTVLSDPDLREDWLRELGEMRERLAGLRLALAAVGRELGVDLDHVAAERGIFSLMDISPQTVLDLRQKFGIYMPRSGRINIAGLQISDVYRLVTAISAHRRWL